MNIKRGVFRLWLVLSVGWIAFMGLDYYERIKSPYIPRQEFRYFPETKTFAPHVEETDPMKWMEFTTGYDTVEFPNSVVAYIPSKLPGEDLKALARKFQEDFVAPRDVEVSAKRREYLWSFVQSALGPPLAALLIGGALVWAILGFAKPKAE